ncbi:putative amidoligase enzyme-domain-containing protein [Xylaria sp. FL0043]|nr:putative amidoligase enzyme-domain-containing protein [Xylaria sp. FL0043]
MSTTACPAPERPTFGVEIEFMVATLPVDAVDPIDATGLAPVLRTPIIKDNDRYYGEYTLAKVREALRECFGPGPKIDPDNIRDKFLDWQVDADPSISETVPSLPYTFVGVEVSSPVQFATPEAFDVISRAISTITSKFRCIVDVSCGLHVHVGLGEERLSLEQIRRIASLSYAAEPLLFTLHDPVRKVNRYCRPLQDYSYLADKFANQDFNAALETDMYHQGFDASVPTFCQYLGGERRHGEAPMSYRAKNVDEDHIAAFLETRQHGNFEPFTQPGDSRHTVLSPDIPEKVTPIISAPAGPTSPTTISVGAARQRDIPRLRHVRYNIEELLGMSAHLWPRRLTVPTDQLDRLNERGPGPSVFQATEIIYSQPSSDYISELLSGHQRPAIGLQAYECAAMTTRRVLHTIEFRLGEGSLDGEWIATWAKICVGIFKFALYSSPSKFIDILTKCDRAMKEDGTYDVIDLLDDIGLFAEAAIAERRLMANEHRWKLRFMGSKIRESKI